MSVDISADIVPGGLYRHYKGQEYRVLCVAIHEETKEPLVIYQAQYDEGRIWARPLEKFLETITLDGVTTRRFTYVE